MSRIEKTVFISYRRSGGSAWGLAVSQNLTQHGYDVFLDYTGIASGDFEQVILANIRARAHFLVLLTPSALERVDEPGDWLRREIEAALGHKRNIVPLMLEGFDFSTPSMARHLTGTLAPLKSYNGLTVPVAYFDEAMNRLRAKHLHISVEAVLHPASAVAREGAAEQRLAARAAPAVAEQELTAERWFEQGVAASDLDTKLSCYTEAIRLKPTLAEAYLNRGVVRSDRGDLDRALADYEEAIRLKPAFAEAYSNRGLARSGQGNRAGALADYEEAIRLKPDYAQAYFNRAVIRRQQGDIKGALADYGEAIRLKPDDPDAYLNRGYARRANGDREGALADYEEAIRLKPDFAWAYSNRGLVRSDQGDLHGAIADYEEAIRLKPDFAEAYYNRGNVRSDQGNRDGALADYAEAIRLKPAYASAYYNRAVVLRERQADYAAAIADYQRYLEFGGGVRNGNQAEVERRIRELRKKL